MSDDKRMNRNAAILNERLTAEFARGLTIGHALAHAPETGAELDWDKLSAACRVMVGRATQAKEQTQVEDWVAIHSRILELSSTGRDDLTTH